MTDQPAPQPAPQSPPSAHAGPDAAHGQGTLRYHVLLGRSFFSMGAIAPHLVVNGHSMAVNPGVQDIPVPAGRQQLRAWALAPGGPYGVADFEVDVAPNSLVEVYYTPPLTNTKPGIIDFRPRKPLGQARFTLAIVGLGLSMWLFLALIVFVASR